MHVSFNLCLEKLKYVQKWKAFDLLYTSHIWIQCEITLKWRKARELPITDNTNTFHCPRRVIGHIIKLPPLVREFICFVGLSKPENLVAFLGMFEKVCTLSLTSPPSVKDLAMGWLPTASPFPEWATRRDMVMMVFPSPIASAKIFKFTTK